VQLEIASILKKIISYSLSNHFKLFVSAILKKLMNFSVLFAMI